ncbi:MAG TPA: hypothetical protein VKV19_05920, partial [Ktedonobacteraceae bacterium]|nr:hypothetical protein [Ktedonobacteraceae bacterium]
MLLSLKRLRQVLGVLWLIDGLLQLQPEMFSMNMINGVMKPMLEGQPGLIESNLQWIVNVVTSNLTFMNILIAVVQIAIGVLLITGLWVRATVIASMIWALIVWYGGEGLSMLLTGQASVLTGAPGAVMLYPLLGFVVYPREGSNDKEGLISRPVLRWVLAGFWIFAALLQLQPFWWQSQQISGAISDMVGGGGLNRFFVDPLLQWTANVTANAEIPLNIALIVVFLALGIGLAVVKKEQLVPFLIASIVVSAIIWYFTEAFGMIFTGMATDFNSGLLLVVMALACWPRESAAMESKRVRFSSDLRHR